MAHDDFISRGMLRPREGLRKQFLVLTRLPSRNTERGEKIHELRVLGKRYRAYLCLFHSVLGKKEVHAWDKKLSRATKDLAASRSSQVIGKLFKKFGVDPRDFSLTTAPFPSPLTLEKTTKILEECGNLLWRILPDTKTRELREALKQSRKKVVEKGRDARGHHHGPLLHRWRKAIKRHLYQLELATSEKDPAQGKERKRLGELEDRLGKIHDLDELESLLKNSPSGTGRKRLPEKIRARQKKQARKIFRQT